MKKLLIQNLGRLFLAIFLISCVATPTKYGPLLEQGKEGYIDRKTGEKKYEIQVRGNGLTDHITLEGFFHRRASELCGSDQYESTLKREYNTTLHAAIYTGYTFIPARRDDFPHVTGEVRCK
jgi:hypothetical protein